MRFHVTGGTGGVGKCERAGTRACLRGVAAWLAALGLTMFGASAAWAGGWDVEKGGQGGKPPEGFTALFNGTDLTGWKGLTGEGGSPISRAGMSAAQLAEAQKAADERMRAHWSVRDGVLTFDGGGDSLCTEREYGDFEMVLEWKIGPGGDSGVYLRGFPQVQIWDNEVGSGGLYNNEKARSRPLVKADRKPGEWNAMRVLMAGDRVTVDLNGVRVTDNVMLENYWDRGRAVAARGQIELQSHGMPLEFRNLAIRELSESEARDVRMGWFRDARFGMFIHWGLYAIPAGTWNGAKASGTGEWIMLNGKVTAKDYEPLAGKFNPVKFDAKEWVRIAKDAGMKYVVITSKHHDGFCLWDTAQTGYDVMDASPFKRDILKELAEACAAEGLVMCWYHSIMDWHHPDYLPRRAWDPRPETPADFERFHAYLRAQVTELLTKYGQIGIMWFDGEWEETWTGVYGKPLYALCRALQPGVIVNNRVDKGRAGMQGLTMEGEFAGDYGTPEQEIPATGLPGVDWESCMTMNDTWGFRSDDHNWKSSRQMIRMLADCASKGGNFLLNVGPTAEGEIPPESVERLAAIGRWMKVNSASVYGTRAGPFKKLSWGRCTTSAADPKTLYLQVFDWPTDGVVRLAGLRTKVVSARLLAEKGAALNVKGGDDGWEIGVPARMPDEDATVIEVKLDGPAVVEEVPIGAGASGVIRLRAEEATVTGPSARLEHKGGGSEANVGYWFSTQDAAAWTVRIGAAGMYRVSVVSACAPENGGEFSITLGPGTTVRASPAATQAWDDFALTELGTFRLEATRAGVVSVRAESVVKGAALMNLREVVLTPVR